MKAIHATLLSCLTVLTLGAPAVAQDAQAKDREAIIKIAAAFTDAFARADAAALSKFWTPDGDMLDLGGKLTKGRAQIADEFAGAFKAKKGLSLRIEVSSIRFPSADIAVEDGVTTVLSADNDLPERSRYTNVLVKQQDEWLLSSVREAPFVPPTNAEHLQPLEWLIGEWADDSDQAHVGFVRFEWTPDQNYIVATRAVAVKESFLDNGSSRIGWDPVAKIIRTWNFESDGGFGEGSWTQQGDKWISRSSTVLSSGSLMTATTTLTRMDPDTLSWQATEQVVNGKAVPDSPVVRMRRVGSERPATRPVTSADGN